MKWKDRINKILEAERGRLETKLSEAEANYRDTGYQRYYTQMGKYDDELAEIDSFMRSQLKIATAESETRRYRKAINEYRKQLDQYSLYHKGVDRPVEETVSELRTRLELALGEARAR